MSAFRPALTLAIATATLWAGVIGTASASHARTDAAEQGNAKLAPDSALLRNYRWRNLGPGRGGRSIAASGVVGRRHEAYFGATGGGLWKTSDSGQTWIPVTDGQINSASVGAVAVSESNPDVVFIGMGESAIRGNIMPGDGVYRSGDAGRTWTHMGFRTVDAISKIRIHPSNPDIVFVAAFGQYSVPSEERGVFKSTDGGKSWRRVLFRDGKTGAVDITIDRTNPNVLYAAMWEAYRKEYQMSSGGPGSGLFKSTDGGETWKEITRNKGLPAKGLIGRIGVAVSSADANRVYALVENDSGGLFRSNDAGATWELVNSDRSIRQRAFYYTHLFADHKNADVVYVQNVSFFRSADGGKTLNSIGQGTHGDFHDLWIDPADPTHLVVANDGGGTVTTNTGGAYTDQDFSTEQWYHVITTNHQPFHVCGSQQDNTTLCVPSDWNLAQFNATRTARSDTPRFVDITQGGMNVSYRVGGGEPGYIAPDPLDVDVFYAGTNNGRYLDKYNRRTGFSREVNPYPWFYSGEPASAIRERWQWTFPIIFSKADPKLLFVSSQRLWSTVDGGLTWQNRSPDLTRHDPSTLGPSGGPITGDMNGPEVYATIFAVGPGKKNAEIIWTGSDDGLVHVTRDGGKTWSNVTPKEMPDFGRVSQIDASTFDDGTAYVSVRRPLLNDRAPYIFRTNDYGATWRKITTGIASDAYVHVVREDPTRRGLLYAGTQRGVVISYDDGATWSDLSLNMPSTPVADLIVEANELVIGTHGRGFWILDNIGPLRQWTSSLNAAATHLFTPPPALRSTSGANISYTLAKPASRAQLQVMDSTGAVLRSFSIDTTRADGAATAPSGGGGRRGGRVSWLPNLAGLNSFAWDLRTEPIVGFPGMILWGAGLNGPAVPPGRYTLRMTVDGEIMNAPLVVQRNPLIADVSDADLHMQYQFGRMVRDKTTEANEAVIAIRRVKAQVAHRLTQSGDGALKRAADELVRKASDVEQKIYQVKNQSGQDPLNYPIRVNNRLANLLSMSERGDGPPGTYMPEIFGILRDELAGYQSELARMMQTELGAVNAQLSRLGLVLVSASCDKAEGCTAGTA